MKKYRIRTFGDLLRDAEPLTKGQERPERSGAVKVSLVGKAKPPGGGWRPVGRKGGFVRVRGGKREYWYPGQQPQRRRKAKKKTKRPQTRQGPPQLPEGASKPMKAIESTAPVGSAKHRLETGHFQLIKKRAFSRDMDEHQRRKTRWVPNVDDKTKLELISDYQPLLKSLTKKLSRQFHLPRTDTVKEDMMSAGVEGLLVAIDLFKGGAPFNPKLVVHDMMRLHASREFLGFELPEMHARNLARYIAARHQAAKKLGKDDPTPEEVLPFFDLRKRHVHAGLPAYDESRKIGTYPKTMMKEFDLPDGSTEMREVEHPKAGQPMYAPLRNEQLPDRKGYTLPEHLGRRGDPSKPSTRKRVDQPSKLDWAEMYDGFLKGQKTVTPFDAQVIAPGVGIGYGFSVEDQIVIRHDLQQAAQQISKMGPAEIETKSYPGAKAPSTFRVDDLGDIVLRRLGVDQEEHSVQALVRAVPIYKKTKKGWKRVGDRQAHDLMQKFVEKGMGQLPKHTDGSHATRLAERAKEIISPTKSIPKGPSWKQIIKGLAAKFTSAQVKKFRDGYSGEGKERVARMNDGEVRLLMAQRSKTARKLSAEIRRAMTATMTVERVSPLHGIATRFDPDTGEFESFRVRMKHERHFKKSLADLNDQILRDMVRFPKMMSLLTSPHPPTQARAAFERMLGLG